MKKVGKSDVLVSDLIYGCWQMGGDYWGKADDAQLSESCRHALERGVTTFDTAYCYGWGHAETVLGNALQGIPRENYQMISKLWHNSLHYDQAIQACEDTLKRLQVEYLDVYFIHYPDPTNTVPIAETMDALNHLKEQGKIRAIGLSNFSLKQMKEAAQFATIDVNQPCYNLLWRFIDRKILPYCIENDIATVPYSSLAQGLLTGKFTLENRPTADGRRISALCQTPYYENAMPVVQAVVECAKQYNVSAACIALKWLLERQGVTAPIIGISKPEELDDSLVALDVKVSPEDLAHLDEVSRAYTDTLPHFHSLFDPTIVEDPDLDE